MNSKTFLLIAALMVALGLVSLTGQAGAAEAAAGEPPAAEETEPQDPEDGASSEVFIPTEEISEDFAVSFPVDI